MSTKSTGTARGLSLNFVATVAVLGTNVVTGAILARGFAPTERGEVALVLLWPNVIVALSEFGLKDAITFMRASGRMDDPVGLGTGFAIAACEAVLAALVSFGVMLLILPQHGHDVFLAGLLYLLFIPGHFSNLVILSLANGQRRYSLVAWLRALVIVGGAVPIVVLFAVGDLTIEAVTLSYVAAQAVTLLFGVASLRGTWQGLRWDRPMAGELLRYGVRAHVGNISTSLNQRFDQLVVSAFLAVRQLGLYTVAATLTTLTSTVGMTVGYVAVPSIATIEDPERRAAVAQRFITLVLLVSIVVTVPVVVFTGPILKLFFGSDYLPVTDVARVLVVGSIAFSTARAAEGVLRAIGKPWQASKGELLAVGVTLLALGVLLPLFDLMGAAVASLIAYCVSALWMLRVLGRAFDVPWWRPLLLTPRQVGDTWRMLRDRGA